jgi:hypothetical protein
MLTLWDNFGANIEVLYNDAIKNLWIWDESIDFFGENIEELYAIGDRSFGGILPFRTSVPKELRARRWHRCNYIHGCRTFVPFEHSWCEEHYIINRSEYNAYKSFTGPEWARLERDARIAFAKYDFMTLAFTAFYYIAYNILF